MSEEAWNRWGADDEAGALNFIDAAAVLSALAVPRQGKVYALAQPISPRLPVPPHRPGIMHFMGRDGGDYAAGRHATGGFQFSEDTVVLPLHSGTHIDALCHCWREDELYNGFPGNTVRSNGAGKCGIDKMPPIVSRGLLLDFVKLAGAPMADGEAIDAALLTRAIAQTGTQLRQGDVVLLRTGWQERQDEVSGIDFNAEPGLDVEAGLILAEAGVAAVGADNFAVEVMPFASDIAFPVHQRLIRDYGIPLIEGLVLEPFATAETPVFLFMAAPLPVIGGTGSPLTPLAIV
jgi:kynurenine formamidase